MDASKAFEKYCNEESLMAVDKRYKEYWIDGFNFAQRQSAERTLTHDEKLEMVAAMKKYGGSFVAELADCFLYADSENLDKLCAAFPAYVTRYTNLSKRGNQ